MRCKGCGCHPLLVFRKWVPYNTHTLSLQYLSTTSSKQCLQRSLMQEETIEQQQEPNKKCLIWRIFWLITPQRKMTQTSFTDWCGIPTQRSKQLSANSFLPKTIPALYNGLNQVEEVLKVMMETSLATFYLRTHLSPIGGRDIVKGIWNACVHCIAHCFLRRCLSKNYRNS